MIVALNSVTSSREGDEMTLVSERDAREWKFCPVCSYPLVNAMEVDFRAGQVRGWIVGCRNGHEFELVDYVGSVKLFTPYATDVKPFTETIVSKQTGKQGPIPQDSVEGQISLLSPDARSISDFFNKEEKP